MWPQRIFLLKLNSLFHIFNHCLYIFLNIWHFSLAYFYKGLLKFSISMYKNLILRTYIYLATFLQFSFCLLEFWVCFWDLAHLHWIKSKKTLTSAVSASVMILSQYIKYNKAWYSLIYFYYLLFELLFVYLSI